MYHLAENYRNSEINNNFISLSKWKDSLLEIKINLTIRIFKNKKQKMLYYFLFSFIRSNVLYINIYNF